MDQGDRLGEYEIARTLGSGDFASVYEVVASTGDRFAMKVADAGDKRSADRLRFEAAALRQIDIAGVPSFIEEGQAGDRTFLVMSLAPGATLESYLQEHRDRHEQFSALQTLEILVRLLDILCSLADVPHEAKDGRGLAHRDIKPANVMLIPSSSAVTLLDFGFCKEDGSNEKRTDDSFFRAGAARFSPPYKHQYPTHARATHDVFAVGVLAYLMLTNSYPWSSPQDEGEGELVGLMRKRRPTGIRTINNTVPPSVERLIDDMLVTEDARRQSACEFAERARALIEELSNRRGIGTGSDGVLRLTEVWRDELHGDIRLTPYEMEIIDTPEMQRLRRIRQLGLTHYVFGTGDHSRLSHSIGTLFRVNQLLSAMEESSGVRVDPETRLVARAYALIHDVTHIPFGHTLEDEFALFKRHDENEGRVHRLVMDSASALRSVLEKNEIGRHARNLLDPDATIHHHSEVKELVSGMVGADMLDYIDRDSMNLGLDHHIDTAIFRQFTLHRVSGGTQAPQVASLLAGDYGIRLDRQLAVEWVMRERYALFLKAYTHRAKIKASVLLGKAMALATHEFKRPLFPEPAVEWASDDGLVDRLADLPRASRVSDVASALRSRRLPKAVFRSRLLDEDNLNLQSYNARRHELFEDGARFGLFPARSRLDVEKALAAGIPGLRADDIFVYAAQNAPGLKRTEDHRIIAEAGTTHLPQSPWFMDLQRRHLRLWNLWVFVSTDSSPEDRARVAAAAVDRFGLPNELGHDTATSPPLW